MPAPPLARRTRRRTNWECREQVERSPLAFIDQEPKTHGPAYRCLCDKDGGQLWPQGWGGQRRVDLERLSRVGVDAGAVAGRPLQRVDSACEAVARGDCGLAVAFAQYEAGAVTAADGER